jgi:hypothetical protein
MKKIIAHITFALLVSLTTLRAQESPKEEDFYTNYHAPDPGRYHILEVGGLTTMPNGSLALIHTPRRSLDRG